MKYRLELALIALLSASMSHAFVKGKYLPKSELPSSVCKVVAVNLKTKMTPVDQNKQPIGKPKITTTEESVYCSSTLVSPNHVMTAAHCYEGAIEKFMPILSQPVVKKLYNKKTKTYDYPNICKIDRGSRKGELRDDWMKYKFCVAGALHFLQETTIDRVEIRCPLKDGTEEIRTALMEEGWPHPMYVNNHQYNKYDVGLLTVQKPFVQTKPAKMILDQDQMLDIAKKNYMSCRSFGYGLDNEDNYGVLKGIKTPIHKLTEDTITFKSDAYNKNRTDHGDSGGALFCKDQKGNDYLVGVISRGGPLTVDYKTGSTYTDQSLYAVIAYNKLWIDMIMKGNPAPHGFTNKGKEQWRNMTIKFQMKDLKQEIANIETCFKENKKSIPKKHYKVMKEGLKLLKQNYSIRVTDIKDGKDSFYIAGYLAQDYKMKDSLLGTCNRAKKYNRR